MVFLAVLGIGSALGVGFVAGLIPFPEGASWATGTSVAVLLGFGGRQPNGIPPGYFGLSRWERFLRDLPPLAQLPSRLLTFAEDLAALRRTRGIGARNGGAGTIAWPRPVEGSEEDRRIIRRGLEQAGVRHLQEWGIGPSSEVASIGPGSCDLLRQETTAA